MRQACHPERSPCHPERSEGSAQILHDNDNHHVNQIVILRCAQDDKLGAFLSGNS